YTLATKLDPKRFEVAGVISLKSLGAYSEKLVQAGIKTESLGLPDQPSFRHVVRHALCVKKVAALIAAEKPDAVHAMMYQAIQVCRAAKIISNHPFKLLTSPRVNYRTRSRPSLFVDRLLRGNDDLLVAESQGTRSFLIETLGYPAAKIRTIYNGI